jgi:hypothetical protein
MKSASAKGRRKLNRMLKRVQHDKQISVLVSCHPEPGPELDSGSMILGSES